MKVITRQEALDRQMARYFTGKPCAHGHIAERVTSDRHCVVCRRHQACARYASNPDKCREEHRAWAQRNKEWRRRYNKRYAAKHRAAVNASTYRSRRKHKDKYRLTNAIRDEVRRLFGGGHNKRCVSAKYLGCSVPDARAYILGLLKPGMSLENYGEWEIDHIMPLAAFDLSKEEERHRAGHYTNLRPMWKEANREKSSRMPDDRRQIGLFAP